jgi:hypothetical protein
MSKVAGKKPVSKVGKGGVNKEDIGPGGRGKKSPAAKKMAKK